MIVAKVYADERWYVDITESPAHHQLEDAVTRLTPIQKCTAFEQAR